MATIIAWGARVRPASAAAGYFAALRTLPQGSHNDSTATGGRRTRFRFLCSFISPPA